MRIWAILLLLAVSAVPLFAACGGSDLTLRDPALRRQWLIRRDCRYPARPARLVEVPWSGWIAPRANALVPGTTPEGPLIRPGMRVTVEQQSDYARIRLTGIALEAGYAGEKILVKAGLGAAPLPGIVRGPGLVALEPEKGGH
jgi:hypothetical protein